MVIYNTNYFLTFLELLLTEVSFERAVYPMEVSIFETYNPGAMIRIWAWGPSTWMLLWEGEPEYVGDTPRIFSPPIRQMDFPTR